ncbi:oxygen-dependent protoporphyrinogen oxidase [Dinochytrium kinnereticum]|nr:oxygen-dependent protoporphyrinogen oxidase [Dinochytrium kinnereticum]
MLEMIGSLDLKDQIVGVSKSAPAAKNRFIFFQRRLNRLPSSLLSAMTSDIPVLKNVFKGIAREPFVPKSNLPDESIRDFVVRRFGNELADNIVSAVIHGVYAGDINKLSVRSTVKFLWDMEQKHGSIVLGVLKEALSSIGTKEPAVSGFIKEMRKYSVYTFKDGLETLSRAIIADLRKHPQVELLPSTRVASVRTSDQIQVETDTGKAFEADNIIWSIPSKQAAEFMPGAVAPYLSNIQGVDVAVVNLVYNGQVLPVRGFGYLIPQSEPADILGTVFDSETLPSDPPATRLTVMMGGHRFKEKFENPDTVSNDRLLEVAIKGVRDHLNVLAPPISSMVTLQRECIPQYTVGHLDRMRELHAKVKGVADGRFSLIGSSYLGVSLNDCVRHAREVALAISEGKKVTGLEACL